MAQFLTGQGYEIVQCASLERLDQLLDDLERVDLALVDVTGFDATLWNRCDQLRLAGVPFVLVSAASQSAAVQQSAFSHGSRGVLAKPLASRSLLELIRSILDS